MNRQYEVRFASNTAPVEGKMIEASTFAAAARKFIEDYDSFFPKFVSRLTEEILVKDIDGKTRAVLVERTISISYNVISESRIP